MSAPDEWSPEDALGYENALRVTLRGKRLVYEAVLVESARDSLAKNLNALMAAFGSRAREELPRHFPATVAITLALDAVFAYTAGDLWSNTLVHDRRPPILGQVFSDAIKALQLETFPSFDEEHAHKYVSRILAHGGIPKNCLNQFFAFLENNLGTAGLEVSSYQEILRDDYRGALIIPKPVERFLLGTGPVGADFLARSLALVSGEDDDQGVVSDALLAERHGLPQHVVRQFREYTLLAEKRPTAKVASRVPRPRVSLDPGGSSGPRVILPAYPAGAKPGAFWTVALVNASASDKGWPKRVPVSACETRELSLPPADLWRVSFMSDDGQTTYDKLIPALRGNRPLAFHAETGALIEEPRYSPTDRVLLLAACSLASDSPNVAITQELPSLDAQAWADWRLYELSLSGSGKLTGRLVIGEFVDELVTYEFGVRLAPTIEVSDAMAGVLTADGRPVFAVCPAFVSVPWTEESRARWRGAIVVNGERQALEQSALVDATSLTSAVAAMLDVTRLCDARLTLQGSLGESVRYEFALIRGLSVQASTSVLLPEGEPEAVQIRCTDVTLSITDEHDLPVTRVFVDAGHAPPVIVVRDPSGRTILVNLAVQRLTWRLLTDEAAWPTMAAQVQPLRLEAGQPLGDVTLQIARHEQLSYGRLVLMSEGADLQSTQLPQGRGGSGVFAARLAPFGDTISAHPASEFLIALELGARRVPMVRVVDAVVLRLRDVHAENTQSGTTLTLTLEMSKRLVGLMLRLASTDRPWRPPIVRPVETNADGDCKVELDATLVNGRYRVEVGFTDSWRGEQWSEPIPLVVESERAAMAGNSRPQDARDVVVWCVDNHLPVELPTDGLQELASAMLLLLGAEEMPQETRELLARQLIPAKLDWHSAADEAVRKYAADQGVILRASLFLLEADSNAFAGGSARLADRTTPILGVAWLLAHDPALARVLRERVFADLGFATGLTPQEVIGGKPRLQRRSDLDELYRVQRLVAPPLSPTGRAKALLSLISAGKPAVWARLLTDGPVPSCPPPSLTDSTLYAGLAKELRQRLKNHTGRDPFDTIVQVHLVSMAAAVQLLVSGPDKNSARHFLCNLLSLVPGYVENRLLGALAVAYSRIR